MEYTVIWRVELDADSHEGAAKEALTWMRPEVSEATVFTVIDSDGKQRLIDAGGYCAQGTR